MIELCTGGAGWFLVHGFGTIWPNLDLLVRLAHGVHVDTKNARNFVVLLETRKLEVGPHAFGTGTGPGLDNCRTISPVIDSVIVQEYSTITRQLPRAILKQTIPQVQLLEIV